MPLDDAELEGEPLAVFVLGVAGRERRAVASRALEAGLGALAQFGRLVDRAPSSPTEKRGRIGCCVRGRKAQRCGDLDGRGERLRQIGEQRRHLGAALEAVLGRELAAVGLGDQPAFGDADQRVVRLVVVARRRKTARWWRPAERPCA